MRKTEQLPQRISNARRQTTTYTGQTQNQKQTRKSISSGNEKQQEPEANETNHQQATTAAITMVDGNE